MDQNGFFVLAVVLLVAIALVWSISVLVKRLRSGKDNQPKHQ